MLPNTNQETSSINDSTDNKKDGLNQPNKILEKIVDVFLGNSQLKNIQSKTIDVLSDISKTLKEMEKEFKKAFSIEVNRGNDGVKIDTNVDGKSKPIRTSEMSVSGKQQSSGLDDALSKIFDKIVDWMGQDIFGKTDKDITATKTNEVNSVNQNKDITKTIFDSLLRTITGKSDGEKGSPEIALENLIKVEEKILSVLVAIEKVGVQTNQSLTDFEKTVLNVLMDSTQEKQETDYENSLKKQPIEKIDTDSTNQKKEQKQEVKSEKNESNNQPESAGGVGDTIAGIAQGAIGATVAGKAGKSIIGKLGGAIKSLPSGAMSTVGRIGKTMLTKGFGVGAVVGLGAEVASGLVGRDNAAGASLDVLASAAEGAGTGALIGSAVPIVGTGIGAAVGGAIGTAKGLYDNWGVLTGGKSDSDKESIKNFSEYDLSMNDPAMFKEYSEFKKKRIEEISSNKEVSPDDVEATAKNDAIIYITKKMKDKKASTDDVKKTKTVSPEEIKTEKSYSMSEYDEAQKDPEKFKQYSDFKKETYDNLIKNGEFPKVAEIKSKTQAIEKFYPEKVSTTGDVKTGENKKVAPVSAEEIKTEDTQKTNTEKSYSMSELEEAQKDPEKFKQYSDFKKQTYDSMVKNGEHSEIARVESKMKAIEKFYPERVSGGEASKAVPPKADAIDSRDMLPENNSRATTLERSQDELDDIMKSQKAASTQQTPQQNNIVSNNHSTNIMPNRQSTKNMEFSLNRYLDKNFA